MKIDRRRALAAGGAILSTLALPPSLRAQGKPIRIGSTLPLTGPLASLGDHPQGDRRDLRREPEQARRPARPPGRVGAARRPVEARADAHAVRAAHHLGQRRPDPEPLCDGLDPRRDGRGAALQQGAAAHFVRHPEARQVRHAVPDRGFAVRPGERLAESHLRCGGEAAQAAEDGRHRDQQVPVGARHLGRRARGAEEARPHRGAAPGVRVRQPRLRRHRQPRQGGESGLPLGRHQRHRPGADARGDEEDRLPPAGAGAPLPGARPDAEDAGGAGLARAHHLRVAPALHRRPDDRAVREDLCRARQGGRNPVYRGRSAVGDHVRGLAGARGGGDRDEEPRRQDARRVAEEERGQDPVRHAALERPAELRRGRRPVQGQAAAAGKVAGGAPSQWAAPGGERSI